MYVWPPSRKSAPTYGGGWLAIILISYFGFIHTGKSKWAEWENKRKREYAAASIQNLLAYEAQRKEESVATPPTSPTAKAENSSSSNSGAVPVVDASGVEGKVAMKGGEKKGEEEKGDEKKKEAPDAKRMLSLLLDDVENGSITKLGISAQVSTFVPPLVCVI